MGLRTDGLDKVDLALLLALVGSTLAFYLAFLTRSPLIYGWDGPYYLVQLRHIARTGWLKYGDPPLAFYYFFAISALVGDFTLGIKLGTAMMAALMVVPAYCLVRQELGRRAEAVLAGATLALSPHLLRLSCDLLKNLVGSTFLMFSAFFFARGLRRDDGRDLLASSAFLLLASITHILAFCMNVAFLLLYTAFTAICNRQKAADALEGLAIVLSAPLALVLICFPLLPTYFSDLLKIGAFFRDLLRSTGPSYIPFFLEQLLAYATLTICVSGFFPAVKHLRYGESSKAALTLTLSTLGTFISAPIAPPDWYWRLSLMGFFPICVLLPIIAHEARLLSDIAPILPREIRHELTTAVTATGFLVPLLLFTHFNFNLLGPSLDEPMLSDLMAMVDSVPKGSVVVAPNQAVGYWAEYLFDCDWARELEPDLFSRYDHVLVIAGPDFKKPSLPMRLLCVGEVLLLYELIPPPFGAPGPLRAI